MTYNHGIHDEQSDYRIHVCFGEGYVYFFRTIDGHNACQSGKFRMVEGRQSGVSFATSTGYVVPPSAIENLRIKIPDYIMDSLKPNKNDDTSINGRKAEKCVMAMIQDGHILIPNQPYPVTEKSKQLAGIDIEIYSRIQVKCDYSGGIDGTGNLFLQISESNPLGKH